MPSPRKPHAKTPAALRSLYVDLPDYQSRLINRTKKISALQSNCISLSTFLKQSLISGQPIIVPEKLNTFSRGKETHLATSEMYFLNRQPIWNFVLAWLLLAPLVYLAVYGAFSIDHAEFNNPVAGEYGTLLAGRSKAVPMAEIAIAYGVIATVCFLHFRTLAKRCLNFPSLLALPLL